MYAAELSIRTGPPSMISPSSFTRIKSEAFIKLKDTPNGLTQKVVGSTGSRSVICPATPSSNPYFPKIRKAAASRPLRYARSLYLSSNFGGPVKAGIFTLGSALGFVALGVGLEGVVAEPFASVAIADGGDMIGIFVGESGIGNDITEGASYYTEVR